LAKWNVLFEGYLNSLRESSCTLHWIWHSNVLSCLFYFGHFNRSNIHGVPCIKVGVWRLLSLGMCHI